jgi:protein-S-isoprenylcysteine O-methyltransferase Ste14
MPEIQPGASDGLITGGVYSRVRHPRYLGLLLGLLGWTLIANYRGLHVMFAVFLPALYGVILLEEKELRERFGDDYRAYCKRVPGLIPRRL